MRREADQGGQTTGASSAGLVLPLEEVDPSGRLLVGGKAANLATLLRAGLPVPSGFCVSTAAFRQFLRGHHEAALLSLLRRADTEPSPELARLSESIGTCLEDAPIPDVVEQAVLQAWRRQGDSLAYAVRSSASVEDGSGRSFAGQFDSSINVRGRVALLEALRQCWLSLYSPRALAYFARERGSLIRAVMGVVIQEMVPAKKAGIAFTLNPVSGEVDQIVIEGANGPGEAVVSGHVQPERIVIGKSGLSILGRQAVPRTPGLEPSMVREIGKLALEVEVLFGQPMDIEWAVASGRVVLLQARAVTHASYAVSPGSGSTHLSAPSETNGERAWEDRQVWTNVNTAEVMPDVMTPITWSMIRKFLGHLAQSFFCLVGADSTRAPLVGLVGGRLYFNVNTALAAIRPFRGLLPDIPRLPHALGGPHDTLEERGLLDLPEEDLPDMGFRWWRYLLSLPRVIGVLLRHTPRRGDRWTAQLRADNDARDREDFQSLTKAELVDRLQQLVRGGFEGWDLLFLGTQGVSLVIFEKACRDWLQDPDLEMGYRLFSGLGGVPEAEAGLALWRLAVLAHSEPSIEGVVREAADWSAVRSQLGSSEPGRRFLADWAQFMSEHGHHCRGELELFNPRWSETPDYVLGIVRGYLDSLGRSDPLANHQRLTKEREELTAQCVWRLRNPLKRWIFRRSLARAQRLAVNREEWKSQAVRLLAVIRRLLLALGERLQTEERLHQADDIFFLELEEIDAVSAGPALIDSRALVEVRRKEYACNLAHSPPPVVVGVYAPEAQPAGVSPNELLVWEGIPVFPGVVTGRARVILRTDDQEQVLPGEVLVAPFTDPAWSPYFVTAAAVVMDQGGILSHGSIVAREYGLPAVTNVGTATQGIRTGDWIEVDGNRGRVRRLAAEPDPRSPSHSTLSG